MAKKKKKPSGQKTFFRTLAILGVLLIGGIVYGFIGAAPNLSSGEQHRTAVAPAGCLECHMGKSKDIPIIPHRSFDSCRFCHRPKKVE